MGPRWKELAAALKFPKDDIEYFETESITDEEHAVKVLTLWMVCYIIVPDMDLFSVKL